MIGIDLGGTRIKGVALGPDGQILHQINLPTNDDGHDGLSWKIGVREAVDFLTEKSGFDGCAVGISAPGLPDERGESIAFMPGRMEGLEGFSWKKWLSRPAFVLNDAVAALVAEARFGAARGQKTVALLTLGTGVGGAMLIDGRPFGGAFNRAGHFGHMVIVADGEKDVTGMPGSLEECIGNCTVERRTGGRFRTTRDLVSAHLGGGDAAASEIWLRSVRHLAIAVASIGNVFSPETMVIGGGISAAGDALFEPLEQFLAEVEWRPGGHRVRVEKAVFGDRAGAIGAAVFAAEKGATH